MNSLVVTVKAGGTRQCLRRKKDVKIPTENGIYASTGQITPMMNKLKGTSVALFYGLYK